jgi:hypothetical protein
MFVERSGLESTSWFWVHQNNLPNFEWRSSFVRLFVGSFVRSFVRSFVCLFVRLFLRSRIVILLWNYIRLSIVNVYAWRMRNKFSIHLSLLCVCVFVCEGVCVCTSPSFFAVLSFMLIGIMCVCMCVCVCVCICVFVCMFMY